MADWLRDVDTGELIPADQLSSDSYSPVGDWQPLDAQQPEPRQFEFPSWLTTSGGLGSVPARALGSLAQGGAGLEQLLGEGLAGLGFENNPILEDAMLNRRMARDLVSQSVEDNNVQPGSWQDIAGTVGGEALAMAPTLGGGLLLNAGKRALTAAPSMLNRLYMAAAPVALPSGTGYTQLRDEGISPGKAALATGTSFAFNTALNLFDVASLLKPRSFTQRLAPMTITGGLTNAGGAIGDAYIQKEVGAPQTQDEFFRNLGISTLAGTGTGAGMSMLPSIRKADAPQVEPQSMLDVLMQDAGTNPPDNAGGSTGGSGRELLGLPEVDFQPYSRTSESDVPVLDSAKIEDPLIQPVEGYRARDLAAQQQQRDDFFYPEDSELAYLRETPPSDTKEVINIQRGDPSGKKVVDSVAWDAQLTPQEREAADLILQRSAKRSAQARVEDNQAAFNELMAKREEARRPGKESYSTNDGSLVIKTGEATESFPQPIIRSLAEASQTAPSQVVLPPGAERSVVPGPEALAPARVRGPIKESVPNIEQVDVYSPRTPAEIVPTEQLPTRSTLISDSEIPLVGQEPSQLPDGEVLPFDAAQSPSLQSIILNRSSDLAQQREAARRLVSGQRQSASPLIIPSAELPSPNASPIVVEEWYRARSTAPEAQRQKVGQRIANSTKKKVSKAQAGMAANDLLLTPYYAVKWAVGKLGSKGDVPSNMPEFQSMSDSNKRYSSYWGKYLQWMTTTKARNPEAANFIDAVTNSFSDRSTLIFDFNETITPFRELPEPEKIKVGEFLRSARAAVSQTKDPTRGVSLENARRVGLTDAQAKAALSVDSAMTNFLDSLQAEAVEQAIHDQRVAALKLRVPAGDPYALGIQGPKLKGGTFTPRDGLKELERQLKKIEARFNDLRGKSYIPFNRYGNVYITLLNPDGSTAEHRQFTSRDKNYRAALATMAANAKEKELILKHGEQPPRSDNEYAGVSQDILDILGDEAGIKSVDGFSRHLKEFKLVKGEDADVEQAISEYALGASRFISLRRAKRAVEWELATNLAGDNNIALRNKLVSWWNGVQEPGSKVFKDFNDAINFAYIGGNARVAWADMLGKVSMQWPKLSDYVGGLGAEKVFFKTIGNEIDWWRSKTKEDFARRAGQGGSELWDGIVQAQRKNLIPTGIEKRLARLARGRKNSFADYALDMHFALKDVSERSSDVSGFINGWNAFPEWASKQPKGAAIPTRQQFAENFLMETRAVPTQAELPATFRNPVVRTATKFKMYQAKIAKTMIEAGWPARIRYLVLAGLTTGFMGLPGSKDSSNLGRAAGVDVEEELRKKGARSGTLYGPLSKLTGIDMSASAGFGESVPNINNEGWWKKALIGIAGAPADQLTRAIQYFDRGQNIKGVASLPFMPQEASNLLKAYEAQRYGLSTLGGQELISPNDVTIADAAKKALGFQPLAWKEAQALESMRRGAATSGRDNDYINQRLGAALAEGDEAKVRALKEEARQNDLKINQTQVNKYRRAAQGKLNLAIESAPKDMKKRLRDMKQLFD